MGLVDFTFTSFLLECRVVGAGVGRGIKLWLELNLLDPLTIDRCR